jgi:fatty-acyl-CoA synthase
MSGEFTPGLMQRWPMTIDKIITHAKRTHPWRPVVTRDADGEIRRSTYGEVYDTARRISAALLLRGVRQGERVATLAWNTEQHMAAWYGIAGIGAVYHALNPRLFPAQLAWIANQGGARFLFADANFVPLLESLEDSLPQVEAFILLTGQGETSETRLRNWVGFDAFLAEGDGAEPVWGDFEENAACGLCYTSGTTGEPKGVLYSHRSNMLLMLFQGLAFGLGPQAALLPAVPMFHANGWGIPFLAPALGAKLVLPGPRLDGASLHGLMESEGVTWAAGVPTLWLSLLQYVSENKLAFSTLKKLRIGGAPTPPALARAFERLGVALSPGWGMTESGPIGTSGGIAPEDEELGEEAALAARMRQGRNPFGLEMTVVDEVGRDLPRDGKTMGRFMIKGATVASAYFGQDGDILDARGYLDTGDIATIDPWNVMQIADRAKDIIKSGGEWISSVELEGIAASHPASDKCAVIGVPDPKWGERPMLIVQLKPDASATPDDYRRHFNGKIARWQAPDRIEFVQEIPLGPTGKIDKKALRRLFSPAQS